MENSHCIHARPVSRAGFSLIELLVVIAIIGILASIVLASLNTARAKGRDARRISDIKQIQLALNLYYDACGNFPVNIYGTSQNYCGTISSGVGLVASGYISVVPTDPSDATLCTDGSQSSCYPYVGIYPSSGGSPVCSNLVVSYHLGTTLESSNAELSRDVDASKSGYACTNGGTAADFFGLAKGAAGTQCGGAAGTAYPGTETCYDVTP
jgi:prepilin-type N-terminal cleavage/methylation domain-containing protein